MKWPSVNFNGQLQEKKKPTTYSKYELLVDKAKGLGFTAEQIIGELESEKQRIISDARMIGEREPMIKSMARNVKVSCLAAIQLEINLLQKELPHKGEIE